MPEEAKPLTLTLRVTAKSEIADDIFLFELRSPDGAELPAFTPGSHITVTVPTGQKRRYSLSNSPTERQRYVIAVKRERDGRGGSLSFTTEIEEGDAVEIDPPGNEFEMSSAEPRSYIFIAGGIGITPIRSMIKHLIEKGRSNFKLYYFTRSPAMMAFRNEFAGDEFAGQVVLHHDEGDPGRAYDLWPVLEEQRRAHLYCCGPKGLMDAVRDMTGHWSDTAVHFEDFAGVAASRDDDVPFTIKLARSGETVEIPADKTILETLRKRGRILPSSCESGTCGTCRARYLEGEPDHRDLVLSDREKRSEILICVSRAKSPELTLDL
ncbi:phthalate 4,5-dioxygenase, reductase subunit [Rhizobiales bacterium GAS191]|nr:phthalate 4,5-dioxygenase, reductase subunit [Rhizobiales bacterium GAS191]